MKNKERAVACTAGQIAVDGVPEEIKILPLGMVHNMHQDFLVDEESCRAIINQFKGRQLDLVIDYEHQTLKDIQPCRRLDQRYPEGRGCPDRQSGMDAEGTGISEK